MHKRSFHTSVLALFAALALIAIAYGVIARFVLARRMHT